MFAVVSVIQLANFHYFYLTVGVKYKIKTIAKSYFQKPKIHYNKADSKLGDCIL